MDKHTEIFETGLEADAFCAGLELAQNMIDDDHLTWEKEYNGARWVVTVEFIV